MVLLSESINRIKPKRYYVELAEDGFLDEYLKQYFPERIIEDQDFRDEMYDLILEHSKQQVTSLEVYYLEKLCESLGYFNEFTKNRRIESNKP